MASLVETKAVSLRKGNHSENMAFTGVQGEVVVDLGYSDENGNLGTDVNTTLRLHNGITKSGIPMARADLLNVSSQLLAENREIINDKNLAYADLSNLESLSSEDTSSRNKILSTLSSYGLAIESEVQQRLDNKVNLNTDNLNTVYLTSEEIHDGQLNGNKPLAYADTSNINTRDLATPGYHNDSSIGNKPLAYSDFSASDTTNLTKSSESRPISMSGPILASNNCSNIDTTYLTVTSSSRPNTMSGPVLACADLSNVPAESWSEQGIIEIITNGLEKTENKDNTIDPNNIQSTHYPRTQAVVDYINETLNNPSKFANTSLTNISDWDSLFYSQESTIVKYTGSVISSTTGFSKGDVFVTNIALKDDSTGYTYIQVNSIDTDGCVQSISLKQTIGCKNLTSSDILYIESQNGSIAKFTINSAYIDDDVYTYEIDNIIDGGNGFELNKEYVVKNSETYKNLIVAYKPLKIIVSDVLMDGSISSVNFEPQYGLTNINDNVTITSGNSSAQIFVTNQLYNDNGGASALKNDLSNLKGMSNNDRDVEMDSPWRIRHNEDLPSLTETTIPSEQNYTIATNGSVWRALKTIQGSIFDVVFFTLFTPNTSYSTNPAHLHLTTNVLNVNFDVNPYAGGSEQNNNWYQLSSNKHYNLQILHGQLSDNYEFEWSNSSFMSLGYFIADITFNTNVQDATLKIIRQRDNVIRTFPITNRTITCLITADSSYEISATGYSSVYGLLNAADGNQTINVTLDEES